MCYVFIAGPNGHLPKWSDPEELAVGASGEKSVIKWLVLGLAFSFN